MGFDARVDLFKNSERGVFRWEGVEWVPCTMREYTRRAQKRVV